MRLQVGLYAVYLLDWLTVFSKDQFLILRLEDHASNVKYTMHKVFRFLNLGMHPTSCRGVQREFQGCALRGTLWVMPGLNEQTGPGTPQGGSYCTGYGFSGQAGVHCPGEKLQCHPLGEWQVVLLQWDLLATWCPSS